MFSSIKNNKKKLYIFAALFCLILGLLYVIPTGESSTSAQAATQAIYQWDEPNKGYAALDKVWQFKKGIFTLDDWDNAELVHLPETWRHRFGYGSYRLVISDLDPTQSYSFLMPYEATAYSFFVNSSLYYKNGQIGITRETSIPGYAPGLITIPPGSSTFELILHISNFHHRRGGPFQTIFMGKPDAIRELDFKEVLSDGALVITYITMSLYLFTLFVIRREKSILFLGLFFLFAGINNLLGTPNVLIFKAFPHFPWFLYQKLCYYISYLLPVLLLLFAYFLYGIISSKAIKVFVSLYGAIVLFVTLTPPEIFSLYNYLFQLFPLFVFGLILAVFIEAVFLNFPGAKGVLIGHIILCLILISSIFFSNNRISHNTYMPLAFLEYYRVDFTQNFSISLNSFSYLLTLLLINLFSLVFFIKNPSLQKLAGQISIIKEASITEEMITEWGKQFQLSSRESQIAFWLIEGKTNQEISRGLFISMSTVKTHISRIFKKARVASRQELFFLFQKNE